MGVTFPFPPFPWRFKGFWTSHPPSCYVIIRVSLGFLKWSMRPWDYSNYWFFLFSFYTTRHAKGSRVSFDGLLRNAFLCLTPTSIRTRGTSLPVWAVRGFSSSAKGCYPYLYLSMDKWSRGDHGIWKEIPYPHGGKDYSPFGECLSYGHTHRVIKLWLKGGDYLAIYLGMIWVPYFIL